MIRSGPVTTKPDGSAVRTLGVMIRVVIVAVALSLGLTALILLHAARTHDKAAAEASCRQVESLLLVTGRHLADHVRDYATWDDAIEKITLARDAGWWDENAGQYALASFDLSLTLAVDGADQVYFLSTPAGTRQAPAGSVLTPSLRAVLARERRRPVPRSAREQATVGLVRIQDDVYLVAASLLLREDNFSPPAHAPEAVLLFALSVRDRVLPELDLAMGGVRVGQAPAPLSGDASLPLTLADGTAAGVLTWAPAAPGRSLIRNVLPLVVLTLLGVAGLTLVFAFRAHRLAGQLVADERERRELAQRYES